MGFRVVQGLGFCGGVGDPIVSNSQGYGIGA